GWLRTVRAQPAFFTQTPATDVGACSTITAVAGLRAIHTILAKWALFLTLFPNISWWTLTPPSDVLTRGRIVAVTQFCAVVTPCSLGTWVGTHLTLPSIGAFAVSSDGVTVATILALALIAA
ncbi:unnamed protein product, partial [Meganyctiphanes norvegica]